MARLRRQEPRSGASGGTLPLRSLPAPDPGVDWRCLSAISKGLESEVQKRALARELATAGAWQCLRVVAQLIAGGASLELIRLDNAALGQRLPAVMGHRPCQRPTLLGATPACLIGWDAGPSPGETTDTSARALPWSGYRPGPVLLQLFFRARESSSGGEECGAGEEPLACRG